MLISDNKEMIFRKMISLFIGIFLLVSCAAEQGEFEPNNLISNQDDFDAEAELARLTGPPVVDSVSFSNGGYKSGDTIRFTLAYSKKVLVTNTPRIQINLASGTVYANYLSGSTSTSLVFEYTVGGADVDNDGITLVSPMLANGGTIEDYSAQAFDFTYNIPNTALVLVDAIRPNATGVVASADGIYVFGDSIDYTVSIDEVANISGSPGININIGGTTKVARYVSGHGSNTLLFRYTLETGLEDLDGVVTASSFNLGSGSITDIVGNNIVNSFSAPNTSAIIVDSTPPVLTSFVLEGGAGYTQGTGSTGTIVSSGATDMYLGTGCESGGAWVAYNGAPGYTLTANSSNTVYLRLRDSSGNRTSCSSFTIVHDNLNPNNVSGVTVSNNASDIISDLNTWSSASDNGPAGLSHYEYAVSTSTIDTDIIAGGNWVDISLVTSHQEAMTLAGGGTYYSLIKTVDNAGNSSYTASGSWNVTLSPEQLTNLTTVNRGIDFIQVGWGAADDNGTPITDYILQYKENGAGSWVTINDGVSAGTSYTHSALITETVYHYRARAFNGTNYGAWSTTLVTTTLPNDDFFTNPYTAINIGGATNNQIVSFIDGNIITKDGAPLTTLNKGDTYGFVATDFTVIEGTGEFFVAGRLGSGSNTRKANMVWATSAWVGDEFYFNHNRSTPMKLKVFAFTDSTVTVTRGGAPVAVQAISAESGYTFNLPTYGSYEMSSTGFIVAYSYANGAGTLYVDPKPILPASTDLIGIPSNSGRMTSSADGNGFINFHSSGQRITGTANTGSTVNITGYGTRALYQASATRIRATSAIVANSYADNNGNCSAPFVPIAFQKKKFGLNVLSEWVAFASTKAATVTITEPGQVPYNITLTGTSTYTKTPFKHYIAADLPAGTLFESSDRFQMWYEPKNDTNAANDDETVMFGWD